MIPSLDPFSNGPPFPNLLTNTSPTAWPTFQRLPETKNRLRIRTVGLEKTTRFYQASTSELYGMVQEVPQKASWCRTMDSLVGSTYRETFGFAWVVDFSGWVIFQRFIWFSPWIFPELLGEMIPILTIQYFSDGLVQPPSRWVGWMGNNGWVGSVGVRFFVKKTRERYMDYSSSVSVFFW